MILRSQTGSFHPPKEAYGISFQAVPVRCFRSSTETAEGGMALSQVPS